MLTAQIIFCFFRCFSHTLVSKFVMYCSVLYLLFKVVISPVLRWSFRGDAHRLHFYIIRDWEKSGGRGVPLKLFFTSVRKIFNSFYSLFDEKEKKKLLYFPSWCTVKTKNIDLLFCKEFV